MSCRIVGSTDLSATKSAGTGTAAPAGPGENAAVVMRPPATARRLNMPSTIGVMQSEEARVPAAARGPLAGRSAAERVDHPHDGLDLRAAVGVVVAGVQVAPPVPAAVGVAACLGDGLRVEHDHVVGVA